MTFRYFNSYRILKKNFKKAKNLQAEYSIIAKQK